MGRSLGVVCYHERGLAPARYAAVYARHTDAANRRACDPRCGSDLSVLRHRAFRARNGRNFVSVNTKHCMTSMVMRYAALAGLPLLCVCSFAYGQAVTLCDTTVTVPFDQRAVAFKGEVTLVGAVDLRGVRSWRIDSAARVQITGNVRTDATTELEIFADKALRDRARILIGSEVERQPTPLRFRKLLIHGLIDTLRPGTDIDTNSMVTIAGYDCYIDSLHLENNRVVWNENSSAPYRTQGCLEITNARQARILAGIIEISQRFS